MTLDEWMPRLVSAWRRLRDRAVGSGARPEGGSDLALTADERADVVAGAHALSHGLTRERALAGERYFDDAQLLGAYLLLYWPVSYAQARSILGELGGARGRVLDVGSGPGPLAAAALDSGADSVLAIDRSAAALEVARALDSRIVTGRWDPSRPLPDGPFDFVLAGHVVNELYGDDLDARAALVRAMMERLSPSGLVVIVEPALRETSRALLRLRDRLVADGATVRAPCLFRGGCPALARDSDWCHAERTFRAPPLVDELGRAAKLHRDALKMSYLVLQAPGSPWPPASADAQLFRVVSEPLPQKGQHRFVGCGPSGRAPLVLPHKHVRDHNRVFAELARGDVVRVDRLTARGDGLRLDDQTHVERLIDINKS